MKTLTEFSGFVLKDAIAKKAALLSEGKTEEEAQAQILEMLKLDEAKVGFYKNVVDMTSSRMDRVKRVVVALKATETEKVPESYTEREGHFYLIEYFHSADQRTSSARSGDDDRRGGRRDGRRDGRPGDRKGRGDSREGGGRPPRGDRPAPRTDAKFKTDGVPSGEAGAARPARAPRPPREPRAPQAPRAPRAPRPPRAPQGPKGAGELRLVLKGQSETRLQGSAPADAPAAPVTSEAPQA